MKLSDDIGSIKGIGAVKRKLFNKLDIYTIEELLNYYPRAYKDKSNIVDIHNVVIGEYTTIKGTLISKPIENRVKGSMIITKAAIEDQSGIIQAVWFNNQYIKRMLSVDTEYYFYGRIGKNNTIEVPEIEQVGIAKSNILRIIPEYSLTEGLSHKDIRKALDYIFTNQEPKLNDEYDLAFRKEYNIAEINFAYANIHFPNSFDDLELALTRFKFEELLTLQYGLSKLKNLSQRAIGADFSKYLDMGNFIDNLPFKLTAGQIAAINDIKKDVSSGYAMNRLLQGDVGSGKTIVALIALLIAAKSGYQGAFLVPTEILAEQHMLSIKEFFTGININVEILKGGIGAKKKRETLERLASGEINILVGTHAILEDNVIFDKLGLIVTDEQHRFGVKQRASIENKGMAPHVLVMTATPIPRTLSLILYGDLDISTIREKPKNRKKIETYTIDSKKKDRMYGFIKKHIDEGRQAYIICPLVEKSDILELQSAVEYYERVNNGVFKEYRVGLLHGKMKSVEKDEVMEKFRAGDIDILISTTVVEVGVNVINATIMVIEDAERFGLSQLHQLRGRVGRGDKQSFCILISNSNNAISMQRLKIMQETDNGFEIAEKDLKLRGGGELLGMRQHGTIAFKLVDIFRDIELIKTTKEAANYLLNNENEDNKDIRSYILKKLYKEIEEITLN